MTLFASVSVSTHSAAGCARLVSTPRRVQAGLALIRVGYSPSVSGFSYAVMLLAD